MNTNQPIYFDGKKVQIKCVKCNTYFKSENKSTGTLFCSNVCKQEFDYTIAPTLVTKTLK